MIYNAIATRGDCASRYLSLSFIKSNVTQVPASMTHYSVKVAPAARTILSIPKVCGVSYLLTKESGHHGNKMNFYLFSNSKRSLDISTDATTK
jgi:hypothetical protein